MISKIWKDPVGSTLISACIIGGLGYLSNLWTDGRVLYALGIVWDWIFAFLFFRIAIIWIVLGIIIIIAGLYVYVSLRHKFDQNNDIPFLSYTEDVFDGYKFRWNYTKDYSGKYKVNNLQLLCPKCETPMHNNYWGGDCPRCSHRVCDNLKTNEKIEAIIVDNINRGMYNKY